MPADTDYRFVPRKVRRSLARAPVRRHFRVPNRVPLEECCMCVGNSKDTRLSVPCGKPAVKWLILTRRSDGGICEECALATHDHRDASKELTYFDAVVRHIMRS